MEDTSSELKANDKMTDELSPDGSHSALHSPGILLQRRASPPGSLAILRIYIYLFLGVMVLRHTVSLPLSQPAADYLAQKHFFQRL